MTEHPVDAFENDPYVLNHPVAKPFWRAAAEGRLMLPHCRSCGRTHWYPRPFCPFCQAVDLDWVEAKGTGSIYSFSVMRRAQPEYVVALVALDEGPHLMANIVDCYPQSLAIGQRVSVRFVQTSEGRHVPAFGLAGESGEAA